MTPTLEAGDDRNNPEQCGGRSFAICLVRAPGAAAAAAFYAPVLGRNTHDAACRIESTRWCVE